MKLSTVLLGAVAMLGVATAAQATSTKPPVQFGAGPSFDQVQFDRWHRPHWPPPHRHDPGGNGGDGGTPAVPEPGTWAMLIVGAGLVGFQLRRKKITLS